MMRQKEKMNMQTGSHEKKKIDFKETHKKTNGKKERGKVWGGETDNEKTGFGKT